MRRINQCIGKPMISLLSQLHRIEAWHELLLSVLPATLQSSCKLLSFKQGRMMIGIENPSLATELRFYLPELRDKLRRAGLYQLSGIDCKILHAVHTKAHRPDKRPVTPMNHATESLVAVSERLTHPPLQAIFLQLANTIKNRSN